MAQKILMHNFPEDTYDKAEPAARSLEYIEQNYNEKRNLSLCAYGVWCR